MSVEEHKLQSFRGQAKNSCLKGLHCSSDKVGSRHLQRRHPVHFSSNELQLPGPRGTTTSIVVSSIACMETPFMLP